MRLALDLLRLVSLILRTITITFGDRLMVGHQVLVLSIGVRISIPELEKITLI